MKLNHSICEDCGMVVSPGEYHPFAACLMFKACRDGDQVRANLDVVRFHSAQQDTTRELARTRNGAKIMERTLEGAAAEIAQLRQALKDCQTVAIMRGDQFLPDCIDNTGQLYQSAWLAAQLGKR